MIKETAQIVAAFMVGNQVAESDIPEMIRSTYQALMSAGQPQKVEAATPPGPAVSLRKSVSADGIICLECGKKLSMLKRHLHSEHNLSIDDYRGKWRLPADYPMVSANYSSVRSNLATKAGLGRKRLTLI
jgi:predicted transcriptional regulator